MADFHERLNFDGSIDEVYRGITRDYQLEDIKEANVIQVGFEDFNVRLRTANDDVLVKIFSKARKVDEIERSAEVVKVVTDNGVNHPPVLLDSQGSLLHTDEKSGLKMIAMEFIEGKTFFDSGTIPDDVQLEKIAQQAVKINSIAYDPPYIFDSWAIPNMKWMFDQTKDQLSQEGLELVTKAFKYFEAIPVPELPKCLVHGDLIKTNLIAGNNGQIYVIDFSVTNTYPRIQELAVMAANLLFDEKAESNSSLHARVEKVTDAYFKAGGTLTDLEINNVFNYALPGAAMEYMGSVHERMKGDTSEEILYWEKLGLNSLREALK